jgi:hypothetical protein
MQLDGAIPRGRTRQGARRPLALSPVCNCHSLYMGWKRRPKAEVRT